MDLSKLSLVFKIIIIGIIYIIIFLALRIMYKDIKNGGKKRSNRRSFGLEIVAVGENSALRKGGVVPIRGEVTIGRKSNNMLIVDDPYASGHHARIYIKNNDCILEDLGSTNGTLLNGLKVNGREPLSAGDEIRIGSTCLKVIG